MRALNVNGGFSQQAFERCLARRHVELNLQGPQFSFVQAVQGDGGLSFVAGGGANLLGAAAVARHVVPVLRRQRRGSLVIVGSLLGHIAVPEMTPYVVSKWGVRGLVRQLRVDNRDLPRYRMSADEIMAKAFEFA